jgi:hypothetical protein
MSRTPHCSLRFALTPSCILAVALSMAASASSYSTAAHAEDLIVRYDQAQLLRLPRPVNEIIVGNPSIADVSVQGGNLLVITGKTFGVTNVIALDAERNIIQDQRILVERDQTVINLRKGVARETYSCTPQCQPNLTIGDDKTYFEMIAGQNAQKTSFSDNGSSAEKGGN